ncbi:HGL294Cp [Eremothecium sinecaudum]|uniref:HGL294Cp n=1 Tax=Eremothecium sinecaudum TaxID=45286 RepID=A0A0X8HUL7_9SACH|nr:HGL294Cp [Eremothecium sinecaudum]AMD22046.1 HGL294Cp [Eremothecium sinecaudum]
MDKYGLKGLVQVIKHDKQYDPSMTMGMDLSSMLHSLQVSDMDSTNTTVSNDHHALDTFPSPWVETSRSEVEPRFTIPESFKNIVGVLGQQSTDFTSVARDHPRISLLQDETLFYLFYKHPGTVLQELTYLELRKRNWRYHKTLKVWLTKDPLMEPIVSQDSTSERGSYVFFDPQRWDKCERDFVLHYNAIM